jgi:arylsulfatase A-like enzyme
MEVMVFCFFATSYSLSSIFFLLSDFPYHSDFSYNIENPVIPTPFIDEVAKNGIQLKQLYTHSVCTPSRAALMTGRYHINTGLTTVLAPGTPAGLPDELPTFPQLLRNKANYTTAMVGKWHLGNAQMKQTPIGKGFDYFTGKPSFFFLFSSILDNFS